MLYSAIIILLCNLSYYDCRALKLFRDLYLYAVEEP